MYVNNSLLGLLRRCETACYLQWGRERVMTEHDAPGPMHIGRVVHKVLDHFYQREQHNFGAIWAQEVGDGLPTAERLYSVNVEQVLEHWIVAQGLQERKIKILATELTLEAPVAHLMGEDVMFYGTIDAVIEWSGQTWLLEHKTTGNMDSDWEHQWEMSAQPQGYVWLLRQNGYPVKGAFINGLEIRKLPPWDGNYAKKCGTHKLTYAQCQSQHVKHAWIGPLTWSEARLAQWQRDVEHQARRLMQIRDAVEQGHSLANIQMNGQFTWPGCMRCQYRGFCKAGRPLDGLDSMMTYVPWKREEHETEGDERL